MMKIHAPSDRTNPSRSRENGRDPRCGSSFEVFVTMRMMQKPVMIASVIGASTPPHTIVSHTPSLTLRYA